MREGGREGRKVGGSEGGKEEGKVGGSEEKKESRGGCPEWEWEPWMLKFLG